MAVTESQPEWSRPAYNRTLLCHLDHGTKCHIRPFLEHLQGQGRPHLSVQFRCLMFLLSVEKSLYFVEFLQTGVCREQEGASRTLTLSPHCGHVPTHPHVREMVASDGILGLITPLWGWGSTALMSFTSHWATSASRVEATCPEQPLSSRAPSDTWLCTCKSFKKQT